MARVHLKLEDIDTRRRAWARYYIYRKWIKENAAYNLKAPIENRYHLPVYIDFSEEQDAIMFRLKFQL